MYQDLKKQVLEANLSLPKHHLVVLTWGNVSVIDRERKVIVIKPSGVEYDVMSLDDMVVVDYEGNVIEGHLKPSSDLMTHLVVYEAFEDVQSVIHTHSKWSTIFAQAGADIPVLGTTHADYFYGNIPCTRPMTRDEIRENYEENTGHVIVETYHEQNLTPSMIPAVNVYSHGPFIFGKSCEDALMHAIVLEEVAMMAYHTKLFNTSIIEAQQSLLDKHFLRKHGKDAYYGQ